MSPESFYARIEPDTNGGCWLWTGASYDNGYGQICSGPHKSAHRWSYSHHVGPIPEGHVVMHTCDVRACVNPNHLKAATQAENVADCHRKGRIRNGENHHLRGGKKKLSLRVAKEIRQKRVSGMRVVDLAKEYGVCSGNILKVLANKIWKEVQ